MSLSAISAKLASAGVLHSIVHAAKQEDCFKPNWTATEVKLFNLLKDVDIDEGIELEDLRKKLAGRAWDDLKKIPKPVDQAIDNLVRCRYALKMRRKCKQFIVPGQHTNTATSGTYSPEPNAAEIRVVRNNRILRSISEVDSVPQLRFIKHVATVCHEVAKFAKEPCYVYWRGVKYFADENGLKPSGTASRRFQVSLSSLNEALALDTPRYGKYAKIDYKTALDTTLRELTFRTNQAYKLLDIVEVASVKLGRLYKTLKRQDMSSAQILEVLASVLDRLLRALEKNKQDRNPKLAVSSASKLYVFDASALSVLTDAASELGGLLDMLLSPKYDNASEVPADDVEEYVKTALKSLRKFKSLVKPAT